MMSFAEIQLQLVKERRAEQIREAAEARRFASRSRRQSVRRAVGQSLVRAGERLAGERSLGLARSR
jgi:hypothetical protein